MTVASKAFDELIRCCQAKDPDLEVEQVLQVLIPSLPDQDEDGYWAAVQADPFGSWLLSWGNVDCQDIDPERLAMLCEDVVCRMLAKDNWLYFHEDGYLACFESNPFLDLLLDPRFWGWVRKVEPKVDDTLAEIFAGLYLEAEAVGADAQWELLRAFEANGAVGNRGLELLFLRAETLALLLYICLCKVGEREGVWECFSCQNLSGRRAFQRLGWLLGAPLEICSAPSAPLEDDPVTLAAPLGFLLDAWAREAKTSTRAVTDQLIPLSRDEIDNSGRGSSKYSRFLHTTEQMPDLLRRFMGGHCLARDFDSRDYRHNLELMAATVELQMRLADQSPYVVSCVHRDRKDHVVRCDSTVRVLVSREDFPQMAQELYEALGRYFQGNEIASALVDLRQGFAELLEWESNVRGCYLPDDSYELRAVRVRILAFFVLVGICGQHGLGLMSTQDPGKLLKTPAACMEKKGMGMDHSLVVTELGAGDVGRWQLDCDFSGGRLMVNGEQVKSPEITVGVDFDRDIRLRNSEHVSRRHLLIGFQKGGWYARSWQDRNGTAIKRADGRIQRLEPGQMVEIKRGDVLLLAPLQDRNGVIYPNEKGASLAIF